MVFASVSKLSNGNYKSWAFSVKALLRRSKLWTYVDPGVRPASVTVADWTVGDEEALTTIQLLVEENQQDVIRDKQTAKATWDALKMHHTKLRLGQTLSVIVQIANQSYNEDDSMEEYLGAFEELYGRLDNAGIVMQECIKVGLVLRGLPSTYRPLIMALEARDETNLTLAMVKAKLVDEANNYRQQQEHNSNEQVLKIRGCRWTETGHEELKEFGEEKKKKKSREETQKVRENNRNDSFTFAAKPNRGSSRAWVIDTGTTAHLTSDRSAFVRFDSSVRPVIYTADGKLLRTAGSGDCSLQCIDGNGQKVSITLTGVVYAPDVEGSLLSIGKLAEKGVQTEFGGGKCVLTYDTRVIATADKSHDGLYHLHLAKEKSLQVVNHKLNKDCINTRHRDRDSETFAEMERKNLASGMLSKDCGRVGKIVRLPSPVKDEKRSREVLDIVHIDVCGPHTTTPGGSKYYMTMIDDHSRYTVVYFLKDRSQIDEKFREYVSSVQKLFGRVPSMILSARGGECIGNGLRKFCEKKGIKLEWTDGESIVEEKRRSLYEMGIRMLMEAGLDRKFWAEAVNTATYIQNGLTSKAIVTTPFEIWFRRKPNVKLMRIFGCSAYVRTKPQADEKLVFVGLSSDLMAYRLLDPRSGRIVTSKDVRFVELTNAVKVDQPQAVSVCRKRRKLKESNYEFFGFDDDAESIVGASIELADAAPGQEEQINGVQAQEELDSQRDIQPVPGGYIGVEGSSVVSQEAGGAWITVRRR